jgi:hypothetical protein
MVVAKLDTKELDRLIGELETKADGVIRATAFQVQGEAATRAPWKTGYLSDSIHVEPKGRLLYWVADGTEYGIFQELGHHARNGKFITPHPFIVPAVESVRAQFNQMIAEIFR